MRSQLIVSSVNSQTWAICQVSLIVCQMHFCYSYLLMSMYNLCMDWDNSFPGTALCARCMRSEPESCWPSPSFLRLGKSVCKWKIFSGRIWRLNHYIRRMYTYLPSQHTHLGPIWAKCGQVGLGGLGQTSLAPMRAHHGHMKHIRWRLLKFPSWMFLYLIQWTH